MRQWGRSLLLACLVPVLPAYSSALEKDLLPDGRETVVLRPGERNPFGQLALPVVEAEVQAAETEEIRLRKILGSLKVGGRSTKGKTGSFLLGSLILKEGDQLPALVENQSEILKVARVSPDEAVITFFERDQTVEPRQITIRLNMKPSVESLLYGDAVKSLVPTGKDGRPMLEKLKLDGTENLLKGTRESELQGIAERKFEMMGEQNVSEKNPAGK